MNAVDVWATQPKRTASSNSSWRDWLGIVASVGCAIHCAAMPFVIAYLPAWGLSFLADEAFHKWMALVCFLIAIAAFVPGIRKHENWLPISIGAFGLALITVAAFGLAGECCPSCESSKIATDDSVTCVDCVDCSQCQSQRTELESNESSLGEFSASDNQQDLLSKLAPWITPVGGLLLVFAHLLNRRFGCLCGCCVPNSTADPV